jgi:hypothetical protein
MSPHVDVQVADLVAFHAQPDQVPLEGEARVAVHGALADARVAAEVRVEEHARVVDLGGALVVQAVVGTLALQVVELGAAREADALRPVAGASP